MIVGRAHRPPEVQLPSGHHLQLPLVRHLLLEQHARVPDVRDAHAREVAAQMRSGSDHSGARERRGPQEGEALLRVRGPVVDARQDVGVQIDHARRLRGILVQITGSSLVAAPRRSRTSRLARHLVEHGHAHIIASDAHSAGPRRPPGLGAAVEVARALAPERADWMVTAAPAAIVSGKPLPPVPVSR